MVAITTTFHDEPPQEPRALDLAIPETITSDLALFYVHGGGWHSGSRTAYHPFLTHFSDRGHACASVGYRIEDSAHLADQMVDVATGYQRFLDVLRQRDRPTRVVVTGSSAGAHLASLLALRDPAPWIPARQDWVAPIACVSVNGPGTLRRWPDMDPQIRKSIERVCDASYDTDPETFVNASPDHDMVATPPDFLFFVVGQERFFPHQYVHALSDQIVAAGSSSRVVLFPDSAHGFFYQLDKPDQQQALAEYTQFLTELESGVSHHGRQSS